MTAHQLAQKLLELPDRDVTIVKWEDEGYVSEYDLHPGGPWLLNGSTVRVQIERRVNGAESGPGCARSGR